MSSLATGVVSSRSSVPVVRSRSMATEVTTNITMNGKSASSMGPIRSNTKLLAGTMDSPTWSRG